MHVAVYRDCYMLQTAYTVRRSPFSTSLYRRRYNVVFVWNDKKKTQTEEIQLNKANIAVFSFLFYHSVSGHRQKRTILSILTTIYFSYCQKYWDWETTKQLFFFARYRWDNIEKLKKNTKK